jgi:hypothetical protein
VYPGSENSDVVAVLYAELGKPGFREFHKTLRTLAINQEVTYILRHFVKVREIIIFNRFYLIKKNHNYQVHLAMSGIKTHNFSGDRH